MGMAMVTKVSNNVLATRVYHLWIPLGFVTAENHDEFGSIILISNRHIELCI